MLLLNFVGRHAESWSSSVGSSSGSSLGIIRGLLLLFLATEVIILTLVSTITPPFTTRNSMSMTIPKVPLGNGNLTMQAIPKLDTCTTTGRIRAHQLISMLNPIRNDKVSSLEVMLHGHTTSTTGDDDGSPCSSKLLMKIGFVTEEVHCSRWIHEAGHLLAELSQEGIVLESVGNVGVGKEGGHGIDVNSVYHFVHCCYIIPTIQRTPLLLKQSLLIRHHGPLLPIHLCHLKHAIMPLLFQLKLDQIIGSNRVDIGVIGS
mmetsp:Transcript_19497/g.42063  ORF Transcript_19497/g.42063 Transcript_19497/m.42063 type:complete len:260 (-) Transcript_19497:928-1707(-)